MKIKDIVSELRLLNYSVGILINRYDSNYTTDENKYETANLLEICSLSYPDGCFSFIGKTIPIPKRPQNRTTDYFLGKLETDKVYKSFAPVFNDFLIKQGFKGVNTYSTTYGIGIFCILGDKRENIDKISAALKFLNINYTNEYSEAHYVYRFIISKSKENIFNIEKFIRQ
ncbi:MAG: hypothetical protein LBI60_06720 [Bacteroidales bacterium]|nr:hypothetical protein [Bacteroidales bacterium]